MKKLLFILLMCYSVYQTAAQPLITNAILPVAGDTITLSVDTILQSPGNSGSNITWNFTALPVHYSSKRIYTNPSATPYASSFPAATLARTDGNGLFYTYWNNTTSQSNYYGFVQPGLLNQNYNSTPIAYYKFPIQYLDSFSTNLTALTNPGNTEGAGRYYFKADAWGTLQLPHTTVSNVVRTKSVLYIGDSVAKNYSLTTEYAWYAGAHKDPLLLISTVVVNGSTTQKIILFNNSSIVGGLINQVHEAMSVSIFPNPVHSDLLVNFNQSKERELVSLMIVDGVGQTYYEKMIDSKTDQYKVDVSAYPAGYYFIRLVLNNEVVHHKFLKE